MEKINPNLEASTQIHKVFHQHEIAEKIHTQKKNNNNKKKIGIN